MVSKEEHETDEEHDRHKHEEEDVELCPPVWQFSLGERNRTATVETCGNPPGSKKE